MGPQLPLKGPQTQAQNQPVANRPIPSYCLRRIERGFMRGKRYLFPWQDIDWTIHEKRGLYTLAVVIAIACLAWVF